MFGLFSRLNRELDWGIAMNTDNKIIVYRSQSEAMFDYALMSGDLAILWGIILILLVSLYAALRLSERNRKKKYGRKI